jgi:hypothetical protein
LDLLRSIPTADVVLKDKIEFITNELTKRISERVSERLIQFLEENYEIIPKKPVVRCGDCKYWNTKTDPGIECEPGETAHYCDLDLMISRIGGFCSYGEKRDNAAIH